MEVSSTHHRAWLSGEAEHSAEPGGKPSLPQGTRATQMTPFLPPQSQNKIGKGYWFGTERVLFIEQTFKETFLFVLKLPLFYSPSPIFKKAYKVHAKL